MHYVVSDIHGCYELFLKLLDKIGFSEDDTLYLLGDLMDRGPDGIRVMQDVMRRKNVKPILGNHEDMFRYAVTSYGKKLPLAERIKANGNFHNWTANNGGDVTWNAWRALSEPEQQAIIEYVNSFSLYRELTVGENRFLLVHAGVGSCAPDKNPADCTLYELIWKRMDYDKTYYPDKFLVTGHTPTVLIDPSCSGRFFRRNNHIAIDCGAVFLGTLGCLCLETLKEIYVS